MKPNDYKIINKEKQKIVTLDQVKQYLRIELANYEDDEMLESMIDAAELMAENFLGYSLGTQEVEQLEYNFCGSKLLLRRKPAYKLIKVFLWNDPSKRSELDSAMYELNVHLSQLELRVPFICKGLGVHYLSGYDDVKLVPEPVRLGLLNHIASMYDDRHQAVMPRASINLYAPYRHVRLG